MNLQDIIEVVSMVSGLDITKRDRHRDYVVCRAIYYKIAKENTQKTILSIAKQIGYNHPTILYGLKTINFDLKKVKYRSIYISSLELLGLKHKEFDKLCKVIVKEKIIYKTCDLPEYIVEHLNKYSNIELAELYETRLKPFRNMVKTRIKPKIY